MVAYTLIKYNILAIHTAVQQKVLIDATVHSERVQVIRCDIKPGSVKRS
jgi:hypothetical protein